MKILVDGHKLGQPEGTGISTYARNLTASLTALGHDVSVLYGYHAAPGSGGKNGQLDEISFYAPHAYTGFSDATLCEQMDILKIAFRNLVRGAACHEIGTDGAAGERSLEDRVPPHCRVLSSTAVYTASWAIFFLTGRFLTVHAPGIDVAHWTAPLPVRLATGRNYYTIHDVIPARLPDTTLDDKPLYMRLLRRIGKTADKIITVSENSKRDIAALCPEAGAKTHNTYQAVEIPPSLIREDAALAPYLEEAYGLSPDGYFIAVGAIEPKKNYGTLIEAYLAANVQSPLVIVGPFGWKYEREKRTFEELAPGRKIIHLEYVPFNALVALVQGARGLVFPSLYEGFGLPVLEAMTLGTPVITSNTSSLPEVGGDAPLYVDPYRPREIAEAIHALENDRELRDRCRARGREQAGQFTPEKYRERLAAIY
ncbi:glycosyltransferase family 4 protein [Desulfovibrio caledoniensis]